MHTPPLVTASLWASLVAAAPFPGTFKASLSKSHSWPESRPNHLARNTSVCAGNTADDRSVWCDYDTSTNYYETWPNTGVVREYWFELTNTTAAPDGVERIVLSVNGSVPGPTIEANWGDTVRVHVTNSLANNGTSLHFHGVRQWFTNPADGVVSITQCPTAPGSSVTYEWVAAQYGSSWYHSHYALQAWEGVFGGLIVHGPATANYDEDLGSLFLNDWNHQTFSALYTAAETLGASPTLDTGLINGTNTYNNGSVGSRFETSFVPGTSYLLRLVNGAIDTHWDFSIDNHTLTVIAADFVPIEPYNTTSVSIGIGQRYDIIVTANQAEVASDFWLRAQPDAFCSSNDNANDIRGIVHYGESTSLPTTTGYTITEKNCAGEPYASIVPTLALNASATGNVSVDTEATVAANSAGLYKWAIGNTSLLVEWDDPTALQIVNNATTFNASDAVIQLPTADEWMVLIIETTINVPHPIHLHGHDFFVLASGAGTYASSGAVLQTDNPPRRDVAMLPGAGYLVLSFQADNPGAWLMHCHIGWHTEEGFGLQFVERYSEIAALYDASVLESQCEAWNDYTNAAMVVQDDSGI